MKVAFLFSGQLRQFSNDLFKKSLSNLTKDLDCSIFSYCWEEEGKSLNHQENISETNIILDIKDRINYIFEDENLVKFGIENFKEFKINLPKKYKEILNSNKYHFGTVNSLPQIYTLHKCYELLEESNDHFDLIFRCRFDSIFIHPFKSLPLKEMINKKYLFHINFGRAYFPNRVYDIFFGGSPQAMKFLKTIWNDIPMLVNNNYRNGLDKRDCCRLLYIASNLNSVKVKSINSRICDVYRFGNDEYLKYLISSHLISISLNLNNLKILVLIFDWFKKNDLINIKIFLYLIKAFIFLPISYVKRLIFIRNLLNFY